MKPAALKPVPSQWLGVPPFSSSYCGLRNAIVLPAAHCVIPSPHWVIPASQFVIPAKAGIQGRGMRGENDPQTPPPTSALNLPVSSFRPPTSSLCCEYPTHRP